MEHVANEDFAATPDRRVTDAQTPDLPHDARRPALTDAPPDMNRITRDEKIAFVVGAIMTLAPLAAAAWGAYHPM